jgi:hypothetical protein
VEESRGGYLATTVGALLGAAVVGLFGCCVGSLYGEYWVRHYDYSRGGDPIPAVWWFLGIAIGVWIGEVIGCWLALDVWDHDGATITAILLTVLLVLSVGGLVLTADDTNDIRILGLTPVLVLIMPAVARAIANSVVPAR